MIVSRKYVLSYLIAFWAFSMLVSGVSAQPGGGFGQPGGGFGGRPEDLLRRDDVRKELELVDDQIKQLDELGNRQREGGRDRFAGLQDLSQEERGQKMREIFEQLAAETQKELDKILLPHQSERLGQLVVQFRLRGGASRALTSTQVTEDLKITDEQKENIQKKADELQGELDKKIAQLREELQAEILKELTPEQQAQWKELVGKPFEFQQTQGGIGGGNFGGGNRGGGPGGQGGQGGDNPRPTRQRPPAE